MKCIKPLRLKNYNSQGIGYNDAYIEVSCGKCHACLCNRRRAWLYRLEVENFDSLLTIFVTFTYDDKYLPRNGAVKKSDLQNFFKKLRNCDDFTYYAIGEYGTRTHRPHYHAVIFFKSITTDYTLVDYSELINRLWYKGFTYVLPVSTRRMNYVLHYHVRPKIVDNRKTFAIFSKGLGLSIFNSEFIRNLAFKNGKMIVHDFEGNAFILPRYYIKKLKDSIIVDGSSMINFNTPDVVNIDTSVQDFRDKYGVLPYRCTESFKLGLFYDILRKDYDKLNKYNTQDKLI